MHLLEGIVGKARQFFGMHGAATTDSGTDAIIDVINSQSGGLASLMSRFERAGLQPQLASWMGSGAALPVSADQMETVLGSDVMISIAGKLGIPRARAAALVAEKLPELIREYGPAVSALADKYRKP